MAFALYSSVQKTFLKSNPTNHKLIRVLIIDDSPIIQEVFSSQLALDPDIEVVGVASNPFIARELILKLKPDVLTLDIEMPRMNGLNFLQCLMQHYPLPVIIVSSLSRLGGETALKAMDIGAVEVLCKPHLSYSKQEMIFELREKIKSAAQVKFFIKEKNAQTPCSENHNFSSSANSASMIAIGASTGGTQAIESLLTTLPTNTPGLLVVQHMPQHFTRSFAERLNNLCNIEVKEAADGDFVVPGRALIAPGSYHMKVYRSGPNYRVHIGSGPLVNGHRPSVDELFQSVAKYAAHTAIGVLLTGMGKDGAQGLLQMQRTGAATIAQDEASSIVFGMPKEAIVLGAANHILPLQQISRKILQLAASRKEKNKSPALKHA